MKRKIALFIVLIILAYAGCRRLLYNDYSNEKAVEYLVKHAKSHSKSRCALYVRRAISAGGCPTFLQPPSACDYAEFRQFLRYHERNALTSKSPQRTFSPFPYLCFGGEGKAPHLSSCRQVLRAARPKDACQSKNCSIVITFIFCSITLEINDTKIPFSNTVATLVEIEIAGKITNYISLNLTLLPHSNSK